MKEKNCHYCFLISWGMHVQSYYIYLKAWTCGQYFFTLNKFYTLFNQNKCYVCMALGEEGEGKAVNYMMPIVDNESFLVFSKPIYILC